MKHLKKYFNQKKGYSLKEFFNMVMTVMTCFFTKIINENSKWAIKKMAVGKLSGMKQRLSVSMDWRSDTDKIADGQAVVEQIGMRGRKGNRIRDVSYEKGLPCMERWVCRGSP